MVSPQNDEPGAEFLRRLAAGTAHDVNNLLLLVNGCAELALDDDTLRPHTRKLVHDILATGARAAALTRQLLALGRPSVASVAGVDVAALLRSSESLLGMLVGGRIKLQLESGTAPLWVMSNASQLEQVLVNLALNARDAMPEGGTLSITAGAVASQGSRASAPKPSRELGRVVVTVADSGSGIDPAIRERMYEPYATTKHDTTHSGLGLAVVRAIVDQLGGAIHVSTSSERGTTFVIDLPQAGEPATPAVTS